MKQRTAMTFVILLGFVSLFADMTYEGARSAIGQYLAILGASGAAVGFVAGFGEFVGYGFRIISGYISDKTHKYWFMTILGYAINVLAVPLIALAGNWPLAATLIILERFGKALRSPSKDAMLSYAAHQMGRGWGFGLHEAMDQIGAMIGPLIVSAVLYFNGTYQMGFAVLLIPALCTLLVLGIARYMYPNPQDLEIKVPEIQMEGLKKRYWIYIIGVSLVAAGYVDYPLIAYHLQKTTHIPPVWTPIFFSIAMAAAGITALICGKLYDKFGLTVLTLVTLISSFFVIFVFVESFAWVLFGTVLWGMGLGAQESVMRAEVANLTRPDKRGTAYGVMHTWFGVFWFAGSALMGYFYDISLVWLIAFSLAAQWAAIPLFLWVGRMNKKGSQ